ncbi:MAG: peptidoglycan DD-metalloendopeptidase family protein [Oscillospiraceae bacterium]|nr:peptidoglycan DD-metalloendopeptidase family protein [Oscillospiraceae bacterium]MBO5917502.1 peptidoglycan DD-metalloendopeptidase family protein [Oscillospiraceae bacterium]
MEQKRGLCYLLRLLSVLLALTVFLSAQGVLAPAGYATTKSELDALKAESAQLDKEKKALEQELKQIGKEKKDAQKRKGVLEQQIGTIEGEIKNIDRQINTYDTLIVEKETALQVNEAEEARLFDLFCQRVRYMEEEGQSNYWAVLFNAESFSDLLDRLVMMDEIMAYDNDVMDDLLTTRAQIQTDKTELESARSERQTAKTTRESSVKELEGKEKEVQGILSELSKDEAHTKKELKELEAMAKAMDDEITRKERELAEKEKQNPGSTTVSTESGYLWPLPSYKNLSSLYAGRIDPFTGKPATHTGIDVPAPKGTKVLAAKSGTVLTSAYNKGGYGNYVVVRHSSGNTTLYAHLSSRSVKEGDSVKQGQVVGLVGSTGRSTGNHLHYEIRVNNARIDPVTKYSGLTYKGKAI